MKKVIGIITLIVVLIVLLVFLVNTLGAEGGTFLIWLLISSWIVIIVITIATAVSKGYSGFLAFLLGLFIPLLGSLLVILLLPNKIETEEYFRQIRNTINKSSKKRRCKKCGKEVDAGYSGCPHCSSMDLEDI